jgi:hypothetical protein
MKRTGIHRLLRRPDELANDSVPAVSREAAAEHNRHVVERKVVDSS